jgi:hypothetical protein
MPSLAELRRRALASLIPPQWLRLSEWIAYGGSSKFRYLIACAGAVTFAGAILVAASGTS